jgi:uncharacterized protein (TIGR02246 family)
MTREVIEMRIWLLVLVFLVVPILPAHGTEDARDEAAVRELIDRLTAAYNRQDAKAMAALFEPEADIVSINTYRGTAGIQRFFAGMNGDPIESPSKTSPIRFLTKEVAIIDVDMELPGMHGSDGQALPTMKFQASFIAKKVDDNWLFTALRIRTLTTSH